MQFPSAEREQQLGKDFFSLFLLNTIMTVYCSYMIFVEYFFEGSLRWEKGYDDFNRALDSIFYFAASDVFRT